MRKKKKKKNGFRQMNRDDLDWIAEAQCDLAFSVQMSEGPFSHDIANFLLPYEQFRG